MFRKHVYYCGESIPIFCCKNRARKLAKNGMQTDKVLKVLEIASIWNFKRSLGTLAQHMFSAHNRSVGLRMIKERKKTSLSI